MRLKLVGGLALAITLTLSSVSAVPTETATHKAVRVATAWLKGIKTTSLGGPDYDRTDDFGNAWVDVDDNGCSTRNDILIRDLKSEVIDSGCVVKSGVLNDPYTGKVISFKYGRGTSTKVQIDHVIPLHLAWQLGAYKWSFGKRVAFANDPLNLLATDGPTNGSKSDSGPDEWLPPKSSYRCTYVIRFIRIAYLYQLRVTPAMKSSMQSVLGSCKAIVGNPTLLKALPASVYNYAAAIG